MSRGDFKSGMPVPVSPNATSWKQQAEQLAEQNIELASQLEEAHSRLEEIAQLAAPDQEERLENLEKTTKEILAMVRELVRRAQGDPPEALRQAAEPAEPEA